MSALDKAVDIPSNINTYERLLAWAGSALAYSNPTIAVIEAVNRVEKASQSIIFQAADDTYRLLIRQCIPLNPNFMNDRTVKLWQHAEEFSNVVVPAAFKQN